MSSLFFFSFFFKNTKQQPKIVPSPSFGSKETLETREFPLLTRFRKISVSQTSFKIVFEVGNEGNIEQRVPYRSPTYKIEVIFHKLSN